LALVTVFSALALMGLQHVVPYARVFMYAAPIGCIVSAVGFRAIATRLENAASSLRASPAKLALAVAVILGASHTVGYVWFPTSSEKSRRQFYGMAREVLGQTDAGEGVLAAKIGRAHV